MALTCVFSEIVKLNSLLVSAIHCWFGSLQQAWFLRTEDDYDDDDGGGGGADVKFANPKELIIMLHSFHLTDGFEFQILAVEGGRRAVGKDGFLKWEKKGATPSWDGTALLNGSAVAEFLGFPGNFKQRRFFTILRLLTRNQTLHVADRN